MSKSKIIITEFGMRSAPPVEREFGISSKSQYWYTRTHSILHSGPPLVGGRSFQLRSGSDS